VRVLYLRGGVSQFQGANPVDLGFISGANGMERMDSLIMEKHPFI